MDDSRVPSPRTENDGPQTPVDSGAAGEPVTGGSPRVRWRVVALGVAASLPGLALLCVFAEHVELIYRLVSVVGAIGALAGTVLTLRFVELPPASAEFLAAADPTRPLDESLAAADAALAPAAVGLTREPLSAAAAADPAPEPLPRPR